MASLPASAEPRVDRQAAPVVRATRRTIPSARLLPRRVLAGIALVILCAVLFCLAVLYVSAPTWSPDLWSLSAVIRKGSGGISS